MKWKADPDLYPPHLRSRIRRGMGVGEGLEYKSFLTFDDVPSEGTSDAPPGIVVDRPYVFFSERETTRFFMVERRKSVVDIRENGPILDIDRTLELCTQLRVRHIYRGRFPFPFTIDLLITELLNGKRTFRGESVKTPEDAAKEDVQRRLAVEHIWCREHNIPWTLIIMPKRKVTLAVLRFVRAWFHCEYQPNANLEAAFLRRFEASYRRNVCLATLINTTAKSLRLPTSTAENVFRYCAWTDQIPVSLHHPLALNLPLVLRKDTHA